MKKNKIIIILLGIAIFILVLISILGILYLNTDLFKSNKQIFFKYLLDKNEMLTLVDLEDLDINNKTQKSSAKFNVIYKYNNNLPIIQNDDISQNIRDNVQNLKKYEDIYGIIESNVDIENKKQLHKMQFQKDEEDVINLNIVKDGDKYAFRSNGVANGYIGIENKELKEFFKKLDYDNPELIPDKIDFKEIYKVLSTISQDEKDHIYNTYKNSIFNFIDDSKIQKISNNEYCLVLTQKDCVKLAENILDRLKKDSITLNLIAKKAKNYNSQGEFANINNITNKINEYLKRLDEIELNDEELLKINITISNKKTDKIVISLPEDKKLIFAYKQKEDSKILEISQKNIIKEDTTPFESIINNLFGVKKIRITKNNEKTNYQFIVHDINNIYIEKLKQLETSIKEKQAEIENNQEDENKIKEINDQIEIITKNMENLKEILEKYENIKGEDLEISTNIEIDNENRLSSIYELICGSKFGIDFYDFNVISKDVEEIFSLNEKNSIMINNYTRKSIDKLINNIIEKYKSIVNNKIK